MNFLLVFCSFALSFKFFFEFISVLFKSTHLLVRQINYFLHQVQLYCFPCDIDERRILLVADLLPLLNFSHEFRM